MSTGKKNVILKKGMLMKCSKYLGNWKERFIVLTNERFLTYEAMDKDANCTADLFLVEMEDFNKSTDEESNEFTFMSDGKLYKFRAPDKETLNDWVSAIESALEEMKKSLALVSSYTDSKVEVSPDK